QVIDHGVGGAPQAADTRSQFRVHGPDALRPCQRDDGDERKALRGADCLVADHQAGPYAALLMTYGRREVEDDDGATRQPQRWTSSQPLPSTHLMGVPASGSTRSWSSNPNLAQSSKPSSAISKDSGWGFSKERRNSART